MRRHRMPDIKEGGVNVTPLIDIVMCLIIFFMLVAKIGVSTGAEQMDIPATVLGTDLNKIGIENALTLNVRRGRGDEPMVTALVENRKTELKLADNRGGTVVRPLLEVLKRFRETNDQFRVVIRAEKDLDYRYLEPVLITCAEARVKNVNFNTAEVTASERPR